MKAIVVEFWRKIRSIPSTLRGLTILLWIMGAFVMVASMLLGWKHEDQGPISQSEFWRSGMGPLVFLIGAGMFAAATLIYRGWPWVRHALMLALVALAGSGFVNPDFAGVPKKILLAVAIVTIGMGAWYLYHRRDVVSYFTGNNSREKSHEDQEV